MSELTPQEIPTSEVLLYKSEDGLTRIQVRFVGVTAWLSLNQIAELFDRDKSVISKHIQNVFDEGELEQEATVANYATVQLEGDRRVSRNIAYYNLDVIISVGYRVKSLRGTQFRIWATQRLREYIIKGFTLDDHRLKASDGGAYFDELLERIRDIRSSERVFWRKVLDIYSTSIDYDPFAETSKLFFQTVQNKMHWAIVGQTAAEIVHERADASKPNMGLTTFDGMRPSKSEVVIAKNYLGEAELKKLNLIVSAYLDFAELQAMTRNAMSMAAWIAKLDDFVRVAGFATLDHAGQISHEVAKRKAESEYEKYRKIQASLPQAVDRHFDEAVQKSKRIEKSRPRRKKKTEEHS